MTSDNRVKIADIAKRANVSTGTVDRVIHNRGEVAQKTRDKVLAIIKEMDFEPDILASTLASKKTYRFASLIPAATNDSLFWHQPVIGFEKALKQVKHFGVAHQAFSFNYFDKESFKAAWSELLESEPDGIIVAPSFADVSADFIAQTEERGIPVVFINMNVFNLPKLSFVGQDPLRSGMVAAHLLDFGLKQKGRILIVNIMSEKGGNIHLMSREEGFRNYFHGNGFSGKELFTLNIYGNDPTQIDQMLSEVLSPEGAEEKVAGIFVTNSRVFHVADYLKKTGEKHIRLVGYDLLEVNVDHLMNHHIDFLISQNPIGQGFRSFMALFDSMVLKKNIQKYQYLPIDIITRENIDYYINNLTNE
ncbi:MAG: LacI family transcriptional regulator [Bacteroidales bacterium]|nr:LacI family transcriptional regulator [Bacteroidales bacterium]